MSRVVQYDKTSTYLENMNNAKLQREKRINSELEEMKKDKIELDKLKNEIEYEEKLEKERKALMKRKQYEEYMNYINYNKNRIPESNGELNIKLGGDNRTIKKQNYNEQMDNLCLNPTKNENIPQRQFINYSQAGRNYQRGYSHGYNILTGEIFEPKNKNIENTEKIQYDDNNDNNIKENLNDSNRVKDDNYLAYMEMLRKKELEENNVINNDREDIPYIKEEPYNKREDNEINKDNIKYNIPYQYNEYNEPPKKSYHVVPQNNKENNIIQENNKIYRQYPYNNVLDTTNTEYILNKRKNMTSYDDIYKGKEYQMNQRNLNEKNKKLEQQREYAKILEGQINSKNIYYETMRNLSKNSEPERDRFKYDNNLLFGGMNPYTKINDRNSKLNDIPNEPFSNKNFNFNSNNSYLSTNPIINPGNNYKFNDRIRSGERLQNNGNIIIQK